MVVRVTEPGRPGFQLRKGEEGLSVFQPESVEPPLSEAEILNCFRPDSQALYRSVEEIEAKRLKVVPIPGGAGLSQRLRDAHAEIRPAPGMTRAEFKRALSELE